MSLFPKEKTRSKHAYTLYITSVLLHIDKIDGSGCGSQPLPDTPTTNRRPHQMTSTFDQTKLSSASDKIVPNPVRENKTCEAHECNNPNIGQNPKLYTGLLMVSKEVLKSFWKHRSLPKMRGSYGGI
jgi:hypothetical protein